MNTEIETFVPNLAEKMEIDTIFLCPGITVQLWYWNTMWYWNTIGKTYMVTEIK